MEAQQQESKVKLNREDCPTTKVTVYSGSAEITRGLTTRVKPGVTKITLNGISSQFQQESVRISGASTGVTVLEVTSRTKARKEKKIQVDPERTKQMEELRAQLIQLTDEAKRIEEERDWMVDWSKQLLKPDKNSATGEQVVAEYMRFYRTATSELDARKRQNVQDQRDVQNKLNSPAPLPVSQLNEKKKKTSNAPSTYHTQFIITLATDEKEESEISVLFTYMVNRATWSPSYDIRLVDETIKLSYFGVIQNNTEEDWEDALISLSSSKPTIGTHPPQLKTKNIMKKEDIPRPLIAPSGFAPPPPPTMSYRAAPSTQSQMYSALPAPVAMSVTPPPTSANSSISSSFQISRSYSLPSDGLDHKVLIHSCIMKSRLSYEIVPRMQEKAYLKASINNNTNMPLLAGPSSMFIEGSFIAKEQMKLVNVDEDFVVFLGPDPSIRVTYKHLGFNSDSKGIFKKKNQLEVKTKIFVENTKKLPVEVSVYEQLPKSSDAKVIVTLSKPETGKECRITEANNIKWEQSVKGGETVTLETKYTVEWPLEMEIDQESLI
ncbi:hypothetical protein PROFUN_11790 [Planoprotostelium fungivorum]|uniref:DUF4139 domain-containing protein n=1 Tax=Planoprotostelium fungivorum TaxID=1890364 RepID=A0A2P6N8P2_9EUKA|nr:hypothetical protein PROFUN_11790 [Planoprotostelium fungivorum]